MPVERASDRRPVGSADTDAVGFLTNKQIRGYGATRDPIPARLDRFYHLDGGTRSTGTGPYPSFRGRPLLIGVRAVRRSASRARVGGRAASWTLKRAPQHGRADDAWDLTARSCSATTSHSQ